ncbi:NAD(P)-dependent oxidoreductase [Halomonas sp. TRM85114]|uniref:NAD(P)-dependent oxidoreductase n=1 Tax=Halomonas jincaotanensis TaxID=2810616 RepID=UPI001BD1DBF5|nr:NAD(P)-dependent oxidoreductase [Halomonas jincaotanensis]MBS9403656.1 NAD(P)-dependent oxidoreductase [Halomonas jincaotanensis]
MSETTKEVHQIGFVGLGNMGWPMAANLAAADYRLWVRDADVATTERFCDEYGGAQIASVASDFSSVDVVILMLPNGSIVREVLVGSSGLAGELKPGTVVVDMSSSEATGTAALGQELADLGLIFVDAPVSGGVPRARSGELAVMTGGDAETLQWLASVFATMSSSVVNCGPLGAGHAMKSLNNYVSAAGLVAACEALRIGQAFGIQGETVIQVLNSSTGRNNSTENKLGQHVLNDSFASGFSLSLMCKDLETAIGLADHLRVTLPLGHDLLSIWRRGEAELGPGVDHTAIARLIDSTPPEQ